MNAIDDKQNAFLRRRKQLLNWWRYAGAFMLLGLACFVILLFFYSPALINPFETISRYQTGSMPQSTLVTMAMLTPVFVVMVCFLLFAIIAVMYAAFANERKYLAIIEALQK